MNGRAHAVAVKRLVAGAIENGMDREGMTRGELSRRSGATRAQVNRVLDPGNASIRLDTVVKVARAVNQNLQIVIGR